MEEVKLKMDDTGDGAFYIMNDDNQIGEMVVQLKDGLLIVDHTEVHPEAEGRGLAKKMFGVMVDYARSNQLKVRANCPFVHAQFKRHSSEFEDIWKKEPA